MKIAFIVNIFPSLSETFILNQITGLINHGNKIEIFSHLRGDTFKVHSDVEKYRLLEKTHYRQTVPKNIVLRYCKGMYLAVLLLFKKPYVLMQSFNLFKFGKRIFSLRLLYDAVSYLGLTDYDIIKCHFGPNGVFALRLDELGIIKGKLVTMFHGYDIRLGAESHGNIYKDLFKKGDSFLAISEYSYRNLIDFGASPEKTRIHPIGIDTDSFNFRWDGSKIELSKVVVLSIARLVEEKGLTFGIEAINILSKNMPGLKLEYRIIGDGPLRRDLENLVNKLELNDFVSLPGSMIQNEVVENLHNAHIFMLPSIAEILPVSLIEAQAIGLPAIVSSVGSVDEIVLDGQTGFIVPTGKPNDIAAKLMYLIEHKEMWPIMGRLSRQHIESKYDINKLNDRLVNIYQHLLHK